MPIEIRELNIKVSVSNNQGDQPGANQGPDQAPIPGRDEIIAECIERVMEILKNKNER